MFCRFQADPTKSQRQSDNYFAKRTLAAMLVPAVFVDLLSHQGCVDAYAQPTERCAFRVSIRLLSPSQISVANCDSE